MSGTRDSPDSGLRRFSPVRVLGRIAPTTWLIVATIAYFSVSFALSWLRAVEFQTTTWDQGIYQQALWSTAHGRPFYESPDLETGGYRSLLQIHTVFLFYLLAPLYGALPFQATLFAVQSLIVALAAIPLYFLGRDLTRSAWWGLLPPILYLVWAPTLSSNLYDFHPEAFLPLEVFTVVLLWERGRYLAGAVAVGISFATIELAPVLLLFVGLFFLVPSSETWGRWSQLARNRFPRAAWTSEFRRTFSSPRVRASIALIVACIAAYFLLLYYRVDYLGATLGTLSLPVAPMGYVIGGSPSALGLSLQNLDMGFYDKFTYWVLILALLGFVPLLAPRAMLLSVPWFAFSLLSAGTNYTELGFQYGFIAAATVLVAFAYGLPRAMALARAWERQSLEAGSMRSIRPAPQWGNPRRRGALVAGLVVLVVVNLALTPLNPWLQNQGLGSAYRISYSPSPGFAQLEQLAALVPAGATVLASDNLFPLVANDENAYSFFWTQDNFLALPFNASNPPPYVLLAEDATKAVPSWLAAELYNTTLFGARGVVWTSGVGTALLFEEGYRGPATQFGATPTVPLVESGADLVDSDAGYIPGTNGAVASDPGALGTFFYGPWASLPVGNYTVTLLVKAAALPGTGPPSGDEAVLRIGATGYAQATYFHVSLDFDKFSATGWTTVAFNLTLPGPTIDCTVQGVALSTDVQVSLESMVIAPA